MLILIISDHHYYMIEDHLKARYSSLFDTTGPLVGLEQYEEDVRRFADDSASEQDDFNFLIEEDPEGSIDDTEEVDSLTEENVSVGSRVDQEDRNGIPNHWYQTTVTFAHARIRDYLTIEGNPLTRRWDDCAIVPADLNLIRLSIVHHLLDLLSTDIAEEHSLHSLKAYAKTFWVKHLEEIDFARIDRKEAGKLARELSRLFQNGQRMLEMFSKEEHWFAPGYQFVDTWFSTSRYSDLVRESITKHLETLDSQEQGWASSVTESARALFQPLITACVRKWLTKSGWDDIAYLDKSEAEVCVLYAISLLVSTLSTTLGPSHH